MADDDNLSILIAHLDIKIRDHRLVALLGEDAYRAEYTALVRAGLEIAARRWYPDGAAADDIVGIVAGFRARAGGLTNVSPVAAERVLDAAVNGRPWPPLDWQTAVEAAEFLLAQVVIDIGLKGAEVRELLTTAMERTRQCPADRTARPAANAAVRVTDQDVDALRAACTGGSPDVFMNALRPGSPGLATAIFISAAVTVAARRWITGERGGTWDTRAVIQRVADIRTALAENPPGQHTLDPVTAESVLDDAFAGNLRSRHDLFVVLPAQLFLLATFSADLGDDALEGILADARTFADQWLAGITLPEASTTAAPEAAHASV